MKILIIGLGIYGSNLARDLTALGNEIIGADKLETAVEQVKDFITTVYKVDTTDETQLGVLPLKTVDLVIVAIGENFGASVRTVALLKSMGIKHMYARAIDPLHQSILECFNIDRILTPEQRAASDIALEMLMGSKVEALSVDSDRIIIKFTVPDYFVGDSYTNLRTLGHHGIGLIAATRPVRETNILGVETEHDYPLNINDTNLIVETGDKFTCIGTRKAFREMLKLSK